MPENNRPIGTIQLQGRASPQHGMIEKDDFLHWRLEIQKPYPHVVHFGIVPDRAGRPAPFLHEVEQADGVLIEFDLTSRVDNFDGIYPALETSLDRISIIGPPVTADEA